jgi:hypothetical protein
MGSTSFKRDVCTDDVPAAALLRIAELVEDLTTISPAGYERFGAGLSEVEKVAIEQLACQRFERHQGQMARYAAAATLWHGFIGRTVRREEQSHGAAA